MLRLQAFKMVGSILVKETLMTDVAFCPISLLSAEVKSSARLGSLGASAE